MKNFDVPLFSNTCGKLYTDAVVFASVSKESIIPIRDIKNISFKKSVVWSSLFFIPVPLAVFALSCLVSNNDAFVKMFLYFIGVLFMAICVFKVKKKYTIYIRMENKSLYAIRVAKDNIKDAQKFIYKATELIKEQRALAKIAATAYKKEEAAFSKSVNNVIHH